MSAPPPPSALAAAADRTPVAPRPPPPRLSSLHDSQEQVALRAVPARDVGRGRLLARLAALARLLDGAARGGDRLREVRGVEGVSGWLAARRGAKARNRVGRARRGRRGRQSRPHTPPAQVPTAHDHHAARRGVGGRRARRSRQAPRTEVGGDRAGTAERRTPPQRKRPSLSGVPTGGARSTRACGTAGSQSDTPSPRSDPPLSPRPWWRGPRPGGWAL